MQAFTRVEMEEILIAKLIATASRQIGMFLVILTIVSAAIVAFIIYTMTLGKIREIAVLKLIGTHNSTIASMILQQALGLGVIGFAVGKIAATIWGPAFPRYVLLEPWDAVLGFGIVMLVCVLASTLAIRAALRVDPAAAKRADAHNMIVKLPKGYDTRITAAGGRLSGGQIQRIGLALRNINRQRLT